MLYSIKIENEKINIKNGNNVISVQLPEGRSTRERIMKLSKEHLSGTAESVSEVLLTYKQDLLNFDLEKTVAPVFRKTLMEGSELGDTVFAYGGRGLEGGDVAHIHNLMYGLQNLFGYVDNTGLWSHKAMRKYTEKGSSIPYWERYAIRALIAYAKSVPSLYIYNINSLSIEELHVIYNTLCKESERKDSLRSKSVI